MPSSPSRLRALGLTVAQIAALHGLTVEQVEAGLQAAADVRRQVPPPRPRRMMTRLLQRPDLERWESRRAER